MPVEAQAAGLPVIAYGKGGAAETVLDGRTGVLFDEQTVAGMAGAIERFERLTLAEAEVRAQRGALRARALPRGDGGGDRRRSSYAHTSKYTLTVYNVHMTRVQPERRRQASGELFPTDEPIPASQMIGRSEDVRQVAGALENGTSLVMAGPRRTGKTSVCDAALTKVRARGVYVAAVDLFEMADDAELAEALAGAVLRNRPALRKLLPKARRLGRQALTAAQGAVVMQLKSQLGDAVELALTPGLASHDPQRALAQALELPQRVAVADGKRCVVFFDEFQELAGERRPYGDPDSVTKRMRAIFQRSTQVSYLFTGSLEQRDARPVRPRGPRAERLWQLLPPAADRSRGVGGGAAGALCGRRL